jgi:hypothetical protein
MSSHHIVREKQEPALLIMSLEGFESENLGQILEWSPTLIVNEDIYELVDSMGIKIDAVLTKDPHFYTQESTKLILSDSEPLEDALKFLDESAKYCFTEYSLNVVKDRKKFIKSKENGPKKSFTSNKSKNDNKIT